MKLLLYIVITFVTIISLGHNHIKTNELKNIELIDNNLIYKSNEHAAFTSIINNDDTLFVAFREGPTHNPKTTLEYGRIKIIKRIKNENVDTTTLMCDSMDLRDPFLININGQLRLYCFYTQRKTKGKNFGGTIFFDYKSGDWTSFHNVVLPVDETYVLWKIRKMDNLYYSIGYNMRRGPILFKSDDGIDWSIDSIISANGNYTEGDIVNLNNNNLLIIRNEDTIGAQSVLFNFKNKKFFKRSIASPEILKLDSNYILLGGREYDFDYGKSRPDSIDVSILLINDKLDIIDRLVIPTNRLGDKGYPSFAKRNDTIFISYYFGNYQQSDIYMAKVRVK